MNKNVKMYETQVRVFCTPGLIENLEEYIFPTTTKYWQPKRYDCNIWINIYLVLLIYSGALCAMLC